MKRKLLIAIFTICFPLFIFSANDSSDVVSDSASNAEALIRLDSIVKGLNYKTGQITLADNLVTINVPTGFSFLEGKEARYILEDVWGNPADADVMGVMVPNNVNLLEGSAWAIIYTYETEGHIKDDDAADYDYTQMLEDMKTQTAEASVERVKQKYESIELVGWAKAPFYDKASHKLHWAKELKFGTDSLHTLNYNIRMLGRKGVLVMNIVSGMDNMNIVEQNINSILASTNFNKGNQYEDFDSNTDKVAEYGIGGLIAGGVLLKTGILAKLGFFLVKAWKVIALAIAGGFAAIKKFFKRKPVE